MVLLREVDQRSLTMKYAGRLIRQHERTFLARTTRQAQAAG